MSACKKRQQGSANQIGMVHLLILRYCIYVPTFCLLEWDQVDSHRLVEGFCCVHRTCYMYLSVQ